MDCESKAQGQRIKQRFPICFSPVFCHRDGKLTHIYIPVLQEEQAVNLRHNIDAPAPKTCNNPGNNTAHIGNISSDGMMDRSQKYKKESEAAKISPIPKVVQHSMPQRHSTRFKVKERKKIFFRKHSLSKPAANQCLNFRTGLVCMCCVSVDKFKTISNAKLQGLAESHLDF